MMKKAIKKAYTTSIDVVVSNNFKIACDNRGVKMNVILEAFMKQFAESEFSVIISEDGVRLKQEK